MGERAYKGDASRVLDFVRSSVVCTNVVEMVHVLEFVLAQAQAFVVKNRYDVKFDAATTGGYRDINLHLTFDVLHKTCYAGFVFELQIILDEFLKIKTDEGHKRYIHCRNL